MIEIVWTCDHCGEKERRQSYNGESVPIQPRPSWKWVSDGRLMLFCSICAEKFYPSAS